MIEHKCFSADRERKEGSAVGLEIREDEIPVPEWEGAPHNLEEYYVRDAFTDMGEHPTQNKVMDLERISSVSSEDLCQFGCLPLQFTKLLTMSCSWN